MCPSPEVFAGGSLSIEKKIVTSPKLKTQDLHQLKEMTFEIIFLNCGKIHIL
jgi:hypothetical protein